MENLKITKGTIVRTIMLAIVVINYVLKATGHDVLNVDETAVGTFVETAVSIATIAVNWWYNNSFSTNAKKAQKILEELNNMGDDVSIYDNNKECEE